MLKSDILSKLGKKNSSLSESDVEQIFNIFVKKITSALKDNRNVDDVINDIEQYSQDNASLHDLITEINSSFNKNEKHFLISSLWTVAYATNGLDKYEDALIRKITDLLNKYKNIKKLSADYIGRGGAWLDTGSLEDFYKTSNFVSAIENRQGFKIACLEEIALLNKWINTKHIKEAIKFYGNCEYSNYLKKLI